MVGFPVVEYWMDIGQQKTTRRPRKTSRLGNRAMNWKGRNVFVTGADGFIGSHLAERLVELGADVRALCSTTPWAARLAGRLAAASESGDRARRHSRCPLRGARRGRRGHRFPSRSAHRHSLSYRPRSRFVDTNVEGTLNVLEGARRAGSAGWCTPRRARSTARVRRPHRETHPLQGQSPYSARKSPRTNSRGLPLSLGARGDAAPFQHVWPAPVHPRGPSLRSSSSASREKRSAAGPPGTQRAT